LPPRPHTVTHCRMRPHVPSPPSPLSNAYPLIHSILPSFPLAETSYFPPPCRGFFFFKISRITPHQSPPPCCDRPTLTFTRLHPKVLSFTVNVSQGPLLASSVLVSSPDFPSCPNLSLPVLLDDHITAPETSSPPFSFRVFQFLRGPLFFRTPAFAPFFPPPPGPFNPFSVPPPLSHRSSRSSAIASLLIPAGTITCRFPPPL